MSIMLLASKDKKWIELFKMTERKVLISFVVFCPLGVFFWNCFRESLVKKKLGWKFKFNNFFKINFGEVFQTLFLTKPQKVEKKFLSDFHAKFNFMKKCFLMFSEQIEFSQVKYFTFSFHFIRWFFVDLLFQIHFWFKIWQVPLYGNIVY